MTLTARSGVELLPDPPDDRGRPGLLRLGPRLLGRPLTGVGPIGWIQVLVVTLVVFQRFVVPGTAVSIVLPVAFLVVTALAAGGHVRTDVTGLVLYLLAMAACFSASLMATAWSGVELSMSSLLLLAVVYLPCCLRVSAALRRRLPEVLSLFQNLMVLGAVAAIGQYVAQLAGWQFEDLLEWVPPTLRVANEDFNLTYPLYYGSSILKSNGIVFLEPSFCSQFLALAIVVELLRGGSRWRVPLYGTALISTFSGTGVILLAGGLLVLAFRRGGLWAARAAVVAISAVVVISATPVGQVLADRSTETSQQGSSGNSRFVAPYELVTSAVTSDLAALAVGRGAGSVTRDKGFFNPFNVPANYPALPKLLGEYGLPAMLLFMAFVLRMFLRRVPSPTLGLMACLLYFVLSGALLQPPVVYLCWLLTGMFSEPRPAPPRPVLLRRRVSEASRAPDVVPTLDR